jgi:GTPase SAR1 family protein
MVVLAPIRIIRLDFRKFIQEKSLDTLRGLTADVELWDISGSELESKQLRNELSKCSGVIFVYSLTGLYSFMNVKTQWINKLLPYIPQ